MFRAAPLARCCLAAATAILVFGCSAWTVYDAKRTALRQALQQESNIALAVQGEIARTISGLDLSILAAVHGMSTPGLDIMDPSIRQAVLFAGTAVVEGSNGVFIHDETGRLVYDSVASAPQSLNISDRAYFQAHREQPDLGLVISPPLHARADGNWIIVLSRRINHPDGKFAGVVARPLSVSFFQTMFDALDVGPDGVINLASREGLLIARRPAHEQLVGRDLSGSEMFFRLRDTTAGAFESKSSIDDIRRLYSYRKVDKFPLIISVGFPLREIYAAWLEHALVLASVLLVLTFIAVFFAIAVRRELRRRDTDRSVAARRCTDIGAQLRTLFAQSCDMMLVIRVTNTGEFLYEAVNPVWEDTFLVPAIRAIGQTPRDCLPAKLAANVMAALQRCGDERVPVRLAFTTQTPDKPRSWEGLINPVVDEDGNLFAMIVVARNITERNMLEAGLRQSQRMEAVGQLTAGVAHDFNNMLQGILGSLDLLRDQDSLDDEGRACVEVASDAAQRGATLVHRLLAFSRKQPLDPVLLKPEQVIGDMAQLLCHTLGGQIRLETNIEGQPWPVCADVSQLQNCLFNLAINARDAMPDGGVIRLYVGNANAEAATEVGLLAGDYTYFAVVDEGHGMTPETLERALEPFFTTKPLGKGTGLGLPMVQGFARQSGGDLRIETTPGKGTVVTLWLPRAAQGSESELNPPMETRDNTDYGRQRVLVVDDEAGVRRTLSLFLSKAGYVPVTAEDAQAALKLIRKGEPIDLIIADQSMPGLTGSDLIGEIGLLRADLPAVLITGYDKVGGLGELRGRVTVLRKPFNRITFLRQVQAMLGASATGNLPRIAGESMMIRPGNVISLRPGPPA